MGEGTLQALMRLFEGLPRQGPGSDATTGEALARIGQSLPARPRVLDIGCGSGQQTRVLARALPQADIVAADIHAPYLAGLAGLPTVMRCQASMQALPFAAGSFDLIWSEGAIFIIGFAEGLRRWRSLLTPGGTLVVSDCTWLTAAPPAEAQAFWAASYPAMTSIAGNVATAAAQGFTVTDTLILPREGWWEDYYDPLMDRVDQIALKGVADPDLGAVLGEVKREISVFQRFGESYGYVFYVLRRTES